MHSHAQNEEQGDVPLYVSATLRSVVFSEFTRSIEFHALVSLRSAIVLDSCDPNYSYPLEIRAANSFQAHSRGLNIHTYLPISGVKSGGEHPFETRDPLCTKISKFTYGRNDLSPLLRIASVIAYKGLSSLFIMRGHVCSYALLVPFCYVQHALHSPPLPFRLPHHSYLHRSACKKRKFEIKFIYTIL